MQSDGNRMIRLFLLCLSVAFAAGCRKNEGASPEHAEPVAFALTTPTVEAFDDLPPAPDTELEARAQTDEEAPELNAAMVERFLAYRRARLTASIEAQKRLMQATKDGKSGALDPETFMHEMAAIRRESDEAVATALKHSGLSPAQLEALEAIASQVRVARLTEQSGAPASLNAQIESVTRDAANGQQAELMKQLDEAKVSLERTLRAAEMREKYGDEVVDAMFARAEELEALLQEGMHALGLR